MSFPHHQNLQQGIVNYVCRAFSYLKFNAHVLEEIEFVYFSLLMHFDSFSRKAKGSFYQSRVSL
jgi:hypothetical protein